MSESLIRKGLNIIFKKLNPSKEVREKITGIILEHYRKGIPCTTDDLLSYK